MRPSETTQEMTWKHRTEGSPVAKANIIDPTAWEKTNIRFQMSVAFSPPIDHFSATSRSRSELTFCRRLRPIGHNQGTEIG